MKAEAIFCNCSDVDECVEATHMTATLKSTMTNSFTGKKRCAAALI